jgi:alginate O-acetyltransferase complex protein AlgI
LREYLYFPMGGSRFGEWLTARNYFVVMTLCGLWHGAAWPFVVFGLIQGIWLVLHRGVRSWSRARPRLEAALVSTTGTSVRIAFFLVTFMLTLVVFRTSSLSVAGRMFAGLFSPQSGLSLTLKPTSLYVLTAVVILGHVVSAWPRWPRTFRSLSPPVRGLSYAAAISAALLLAPDAGQAFIYFQF